jgi:Tfp pilus assembly protein PilV
MKCNFLKNWHQAGYTLIETLVASAVMMGAIAAASSLSLAMVTQEEMSERSVRALNHLENIATLYQLGVSTTDIENLLSREPVVYDIVYTPDTKTVTGLGTVNFTDIRMRYMPSAATNAPVANNWTGGSNTLLRTFNVHVMRSNP